MLFSYVLIREERVGVFLSKNPVKILKMCSPNISVELRARSLAMSAPRQRVEPLLRRISKLVLRVQLQNPDMVHSEMSVTNVRAYVSQYSDVCGFQMRSTGGLRR